MTPDALPDTEVRGRRPPLARVVSGFLFGLGFSLALVGIAAMAIAIAERYAGHKPFTTDARLSVESFTPRRTRYNVLIVGSVRNAGNDGWNSVTVEARLLDDRHRVVQICRGWVNGPVRPQQQRYFSVDCEGTDREPVAEHSAYEVEVVNASYDRPEGD